MAALIDDGVDPESPTISQLAPYDQFHGRGLEVTEELAGNISVTANIAPAVVANLCRLAEAGDRDGATAVDESLALLNEALFVEANPIPVKWAMQQRGLIEAGIRLPLTELDPAFHDQVLRAMEAAGI